MVDEKGNVDGIDKMFMADSIATVCGACLGTSTTTTYVESASGVGEGGRTGLTAFTVAILFALALLFSPIPSRSRSSSRWPSSSPRSSSPSPAPPRLRPW